MTGERGRDGATGAEGRAGTTGVSGTPGAPGSAGSAGAAGAPGATGETGATGPRARYGAAGFLILMTFSFFGFVQVDREAERALNADREGCERVNVLRENQAKVLLDQIAQTNVVLSGPLGELERFRESTLESQRLRRAALRRLRASVREHPKLGRPYAIDCSDAFP